MRWIWIDRFTDFEPGRKARAVKNVTLAEDHLHDHYPGYPVMPNSLITEGCAQTAGILLGETIRFRYMVILAKVGKAVFHFPARPGDTLAYSAEILSTSDDGGVTKIDVHVGDRLQGELEIMFAFLRDQPEAAEAAQGIKPSDFLTMMKMLGVIDLTGDEVRLTA